MKVEKTCRGFNKVNLKDKYGYNFTITQSSGDMSDVWLQMKACFIKDKNGKEVDCTGILIDDDIWKQICKARKLARRN